jgi:hypothetical protein
MSSRKFYVGLFLITACTLMLQIVQTRILSIVAWYHLAFFAISMAMFGITAGAVWLYLRRDRFTVATLSYDLAHYGMAFAISIALSLMVQMTLAPLVVPSLSAIWTWIEIALCIAIPFYFSGIVVSLALTRSPFPIGRVYGMDLLGAASGCLGALALLNITDGPSAIFWIATIAAVGAVFFGDSAGVAPSPRPWLDAIFKQRAMLMAILALLAVLNGQTYYGFQPLVAKGQFEDGNSHILRQWNTFSRVAVYPEVTGKPAVWGPSPLFESRWTPITQRWLNIDGAAGTVAYRFTGDFTDFQFLKYDVTNLAYNLPDRQKVAVIGVGGGRDILSAAFFGSKDITGVEINPIFVRLLRNAPGFSDFTNVDKLDGVKFAIDEGRSWFARSDAMFDLIQMSLVDTWAATGAGAFSLSENGLYTVEAWKIILRRLTPTGVFTVSRWYNQDDTDETGRTLSLAMAALQELGVADPERHIFLAASGGVATLLVSRQAFTAADIAALDGAVQQYQFRELVNPATPPQSATLRAIVSAQGRGALEDFTSHQAYDLTPPTDDRPFFFNQLPLSKPIAALSLARILIGSGLASGVRAGNALATVTLLILFVISLALVLVTIVIPLQPATKEVGKRLVFGGTGYFMLIGIGFMMVEMGLLQRMSVFLGHPVYSLSVSLFALILSAGVGSMMSDHLNLASRRSFLIWSVATSLYIFSLRYWLPPALLAFDSAALPIRAAVCVSIIAPAGLLMGVAFPLGMRLISKVDRRPTPWFWGINGAASVLASVLAVATSIALGISTTLAVGAACYLLLFPMAAVLFPAKGSAVAASPVAS